MDLQGHFDLGNELFFNKEYERAVTQYDIVLSVYSDNYIVFHNKGVALTKLGRMQEAIEAFQMPMAAGYADSWLSYGTVARNLGKYQEALQAFAKAFALDPDSSAAYSNYGNTLREFSRPDIAIPFLHLSNKLNPKDMTTRLNLSVSYLMNEELVKGWKYYDARWFYESEICFKPALEGIEFDGTQDLENRIVLVYSEQGLGDCIQFGRYLNVLQDKGAKIIFSCRPPLLRFFNHNYPDITLTSGELLPYHYHVPLMELPKCFGTTIDTIPPVNYTVGSDVIEKWKAKLEPTSKKRVGIVWKSNRDNFINRFKTIELETMLKLKNSNVEFFSLEYECTEAETELLQDYNVKVYGKTLGDFYSAGGFIKNLDLVITIDTASAHLAASLGVPTWTLLPDYAPDWRWFVNRNDSPFYPSMRLFRRQKNGSWENLIDTVNLELENFVRT